MRLFHFCCDHSFEAIGPQGRLLPARELTDRELPWTSRFVWMTDLEQPDRPGLGLTMNLLKCDRTAHRYRVVEDGTCMPWEKAVDYYNLHRWRHQIELSDGARPEHWWVSEFAVPVVYAPFSTTEAKRYAKRVRQV